MTKELRELLPNDEKILDNELSFFEYYKSEPFDTDGFSLNHPVIKKIYKRI